MNIQKIPVGRLNPAAYNPRKNLQQSDPEYKKLKRSIETFGYVEPVIWNGRTGNIVGGHQRFKVLCELGKTEIDCVVVDLEDSEEKSLNLALNKISGEWDENLLAELIADLEKSGNDLDVTGFSESEIESLLNGFYNNNACVEDKFDKEKALAEVEEQGCTTQHGDIYQLGNHRLMCGDPANPDDMEKLMQGQKARLCVTSPTSDYKNIDDWFIAMRPAIKNICRHSDTVCFTIGDWYKTGTQYVEPVFAHSIGLFADCGFRPLWVRIWEKKCRNSAHLSSAKPADNSEYVAAFMGDLVPSGDWVDSEITEHSFVTAFANSNYRFVKRLSKQEKREWGFASLWRIENSDPVELPWRCLKMHSDKGDVVLDSFCDSGTTVIACEQTERVCYAMCNDPKAVEVVIKRWEEFTKEEAVKL